MGKTFPAAKEPRLSDSSATGARQLTNEKTAISERWGWCGAGLEKRIK